MDDIKLVVGILKDATSLLGVPISTEIPPTRPKRYIAVALIGDMSDPLIHRVKFLLTVWGESDLDAHGLAVSAWHALTDAAQDHDTLSHVSLESMSRDEWTATGQARYIVQLDLTINT